MISEFLAALAIVLVIMFARNKAEMFILLFVIGAIYLWAIHSENGDI